MKGVVNQSGCSQNMTALDIIAKSSAFSNFFSDANKKKKEREKHCACMAEEEKEVRALKRKKEELYKQGNPPQSNVGSLVFILEGSCKVIVPDEE